jgi:hypothetical protein
MDSDPDLLTRVVNAIDKEDFFRSTIFNDDFNDWTLAKDLGEFLVRIQPESEIMGHALMLRAHRHLGNREFALRELGECKMRISARELEPWEIEMLLPLLNVEEQLLEEQSAK